MFKFISSVCLFLFLCLALAAEAQIKYISKVCVNDVAGFVYVPANGKVVQRIYWEFGDGFTSNNTDCIHIYATKGNYTVKGFITFRDSSKTTESVSIEIMGIPNANFIYDFFKDSCSNNNQVCLKDLSTPDNAQQPITQKIITWGDGNSYVTNTMYQGEVNCNTYSKADKYKIFVEITDKVGCKNTFKQYVTIKEGIFVNFASYIDYPDCKTAKVCVENLSYHDKSVAAKYTWKIDSLKADTNSRFNNPDCITYKGNKQINISLEGILDNGCKETISRNLAIDLDPIKKVIELSDSLICYGSGLKMVTAKIDKTGLTDIQWYLDKKPLNDHSSEIVFHSDDSLMMPGYHQLECELKRGNCSTKVKKVIHVTGPVASFEVFNFNGCIIPEKRVFFINQSTYDPKYTTFKWTVEDENGDNCITNRSKGKKSDYCDTAVDSFAIHRYRQVLDESLVTFRITDSKTGCYDEEVKLIVNKCSRLCQTLALDIDICLGDLIFDELADVTLPYKISFDREKRWYRYPVTSDSIGPGIFNMDIIFKTTCKRWLELYDNDSFQIRSGSKDFYDTMEVKNKLIIHDNRRDTIKMNVYGKCSPYKASVFFNVKQFHAGENVQIEWGDGSAASLVVSNDMNIDSFTHVYNVPGLDFTVKATVSNPSGCKSVADYYIFFGKVIKIIPDGIPCAKTKGCYTASVYDPVQKILWMPGSHGQQVFWLDKDKVVKDTGFRHCEYFPKGGDQDITLRINDSSGCTETYTGKVFVNEVKAGIKHHPRDIYCTELAQFFDSSTIIGKAGDYITSYLWDFGSKKFTVYDKDPAKAFDLPGDSLRITHVVISNSGCMDTTTSSIRFIGAKTYFKIKDTIACNKLDGVFYNYSENCSKFIWEYGNDSNSTFNTDTKETAYKTYRKVGKYKVRLRGIQSVYNPFTNNIYFCNSIFPDPDYDKDTSRTVWVLPDYESAILCRDTICINDSVEFSSSLDSVYKSSRWSIDDSSFLISNAPYKFSHQFNKEGTFNIKLKPIVPNNNKFLACVDSAVKKVFVVKVRAGFDINDDYVPNIQFINTSTPKYATWAWDFGDNGSGSNTSTKENPEHTYMDPGKQYTVCLIASLKYGCADTVCKPIGPYNNYCSVYNVFTPGDKDGFNDQWDIVIDGESYYNLLIYDRWGVLIYKSDTDNDNGQNTNWNGRVFNTGNECSSGTYYYLFNYTMKLKPDDKKTVEGVITLIR